MKSSHNTSGGDGNGREDDLPVFESLNAGSGRAFGERTPDASSLSTSAAVQAKKKPADTSDFETLRHELNLDHIQRFEPRKAADYVIAGLTPFMIFLMVLTVVWFLLDVRFIYTEVHSGNLRWVSLTFVMGIVALNRVVARDGQDESVLYIFGLVGVVILYTISLQGYDVGSLGGDFMAGPWQVLFNAALVAFIWWMTNRLVHECCIDTHPEAGDVGILTGTAQRLRKAFARSGEQLDQGYGEYVRGTDPISAFDPHELREEKKKQVKAKVDVGERLSPRHPGISIFLFSIPVLFEFALGLRILLNGGESMVLGGYFYVAVYTVSALSLLMLTSLAQVREYFRARRTKLPPGLSVFWCVLGFIMVAIVAFGAAALPMPGMPTPIKVEEHQYDEWKKDRSFQLRPISVDSMQYLEQQRILGYIGTGVLVVLGLFIAYGAIRALGTLAAAIARNRDLYPPYVRRFFGRVDRLLMRLAQVPRLPRIRRPIRVSKDVATACKFTNPLSDASRRRTMASSELIAYSYDALCALAYDMGVPRRPDQTPYEFIAEFPKELGALKEEAVELTNLLVLSNYAGQEFDERVLDRVRKFWHTYQRVRGQVIR